MNKFEKNYFLPVSQTVREIKQSNLQPDVKNKVIINCCNTAIALMSYDMSMFNFWNPWDWYPLYQMHLCIRKTKRLKRMWELVEHMRTKKLNKTKKDVSKNPK